MQVNQLIYLFWDVTGKCNLHCVHCRELSKQASNELTLKEASDFIIEAKKLGAQFVGLLGGEPLLRKDIFEIIRFIKEKGLGVGLGTNGTLINNTLALKIKNTDVDFCFISIDGMEKTHDAIRGKGAFKKALRGIKLLKKKKIPCGIRMTLMKGNSGDIRKVIDLAIKLDVELSIRRVLPCGRATENQVLISPGEYKEAIEVMIDYAKKRNIRIDSLKSTGQIMLRNRDPISFVLTGIADEIIKKYLTNKIIAGCAAGIANCYVDNIGNVYPCASIRISGGNVRKERFTDIWLKSPIFKILRDRDKREGKCRKCYYKYLCGGCRASALLHGGKLIGEDPYCYLDFKK